MTRSIGLFGWFFVAMAAIAAPPSPGNSTCDSEGHGGPCKIAWNMTGDPRSYYRVQQFEPGSETWISLDTPFTDVDPYAVREKPVEGGFLYRTVGCRDLDTEVDCVSTTAHWAPIIVPIDEIPDHLHALDSDGEDVELHISKESGRRSQLIQYNVYKLVIMMNSVDASKLPAMNKPSHAPADGPEHVDPQNFNEMTDEDWIHLNVYGQYEGLRQSKKSTITRNTNAPSA